MSCEQACEKGLGYLGSSPGLSWVIDDWQWDICFAVCVRRVGAVLCDEETYTA